MKTNNKNFQKGAALPTAAIVAVVISLTGLMLHSLVLSNLKVAVAQANNTTAYYCMMAGIELGTAALFMDDTRGQLFDAYKNAYDSGSTKAPLNQEIELPNGKAEVTISVKPNKPGNSKPGPWVCVESKGVYEYKGTRAGDPNPTHIGSAWFLMSDPKVNVYDFNG